MFGVRRIRCLLRREKRGRGGVGVLCVAEAFGEFCGLGLRRVGG